MNVAPTQGAGGGAAPATAGSVLREITGYETAVWTPATSRRQILRQAASRGTSRGLADLNAAGSRTGDQQER